MQQHIQPDATIVDLVRIALEEWKLIALSVVIAVVASVAYALLTTASYRAQVVLIESTTQDGVGAQGLLGQFGGLLGQSGMISGGLQGARARGRVLLQSRTLIEEFINRNNLMPVIFEHADTGHRQRNLTEATEEFARSIYRVGYDRETHLTTVTIEWVDPQVAAEWANGIVALANEYARNRDITDAERSIAYLDAQIAATNVMELRQALYNLLEVEHRTLMLANAREEYLFNVVDAAVEPNMRYKPRRRLIVIIGGLVGLLLGPMLISVKRTLVKLRHSH